MNTIFWNVDTQKDFMYSTGKLYVPGAEAIIPNLGRLTDMAKQYGIRVVNTADLHTEASAEFSAFPAHCMEGTDGQGFIPETAPEDSYAISWNEKGFDPHKVLASRSITLYKDGTDIGEAPHTKQVLDIVNPGMAVVYGVVTNICVDKAVRTLCRAGIGVYVVKDAIKELPGCDVEALYNEWQGCCKRVEFITTDGLEAMLARR
jgi:nicotinamidase/pyrazinamidase